MRAVVLIDLGDDDLVPVTSNEKVRMFTVADDLAAWKTQARAAGLDFYVVDLSLATKFLPRPKEGDGR